MLHAQRINARSAKVHKALALSTRNAVLHRCPAPHAVSIRRLLSSSTPARLNSFPRGPVISPSSGGGGSGRSSSTALWQLLGVAGLITLGAIGLEALQWRTQRKRSGEGQQRMAAAGFPVALVVAIKEAREAQERGEEEVERFERALQAQQQLQAAKIGRVAQQQPQQPQLQQRATRPRSNPFRRPIVADADAAASKALQDEMEQDAVGAGSDARSLLRGVAPSLLKAERLYRALLRTHLGFKGLDLPALHQLVEAGSPTPTQRALGEEVDEATKTRTKEAIEKALTGGASSGATTGEQAATVDKAVLPYVLSLLGHTLHCQARLLQERANADDANDGPFGDMSAAAAAAAAAAGADGAPSPLSLAASVQYRSAERMFLQSLTLYRHDFSMDPRPLAVGVLKHLGQLYADGGDGRQAEQVWIKCQQILQAAKKNMQRWQSKQQQQQQQQQREESNQSLLATSSSSFSSSSPLSSSDLIAPSPSSSYSSSSSFPVPSYSRLCSEVSASLAALYRARGDFERSIAWTQEALREWDAHGSEQRQQDFNNSDGGSFIGSSDLGQLTAATTNADKAATALTSLPRALHLLTGLAADLHASEQREAAYGVALQSMQVLQRIVQLQARARGETVNASSLDSSSSSANNSTPHSVFLSPLFVDQLQHFLVSADPELMSCDTDLRGEATAAYDNLAQMLPADDADRAMRIAKLVQAPVR